MRRVALVTSEKSEQARDSVKAAAVGYQAERVRQREPIARVRRRQMFSNSCDPAAPGRHNSSRRAKFVLVNTVSLWLCICLTSAQGQVCTPFKIDPGAFINIGSGAWSSESSKSAGDRSVRQRGEPAPGLEVTGPTG